VNESPEKMHWRDFRGGGRRELPSANSSQRKRRDKIQGGGDLNGIHRAQRLGPEKGKREGGIVSLVIPPTVQPFSYQRGENGLGVIGTSTEDAEGTWARPVQGTIEKKEASCVTCNNNLRGGEVWTGFLPKRVSGKREKKRSRIEIIQTNKLGGQEKGGAAMTSRSRRREFLTSFQIQKRPDKITRGHTKNTTQRWMGANFMQPEGGVYSRPKRATEHHLERTPFSVQRYGEEKPHRIAGDIIMVGIGERTRDIPSAKRKRTGKLSRICTMED